MTHDLQSPTRDTRPATRDPVMDARDLSFAPVVNAAPKVLTAEQIERYNRDGFIRPLDAFNDLEAQRNRAYFDYLLAELRLLRDGRDTYAINGFHVRCAGLHRLVTDPRLLDCVEDLIGPNIIAWGTHYFCKMPHDPKSVPWHQDASYWPFTPARTVTVWLAIDDADRENSAMKFLPGTHRLGHLRWKETAGEAVLNQEIEDAGRFGEAVYDELKAGQFSLHADMLAHGSDPNRSGRRRCGLTIRYCPPEVEPLDRGWGGMAVLCRGECGRDWWRLNPCPPGEDVGSPITHRNIGGN